MFIVGRSINSLGPVCTYTDKIPSTYPNRWEFTSFGVISTTNLYDYKFESHGELDIFFEGQNSQFDIYEGLFNGAQTQPETLRFKTLEVTPYLDCLSVSPDLLMRDLNKVPYQTKTFYSTGYQSNSSSASPSPSYSAYATTAPDYESSFESSITFTMCGCPKTEFFKKPDYIPMNFMLFIGKTLIKAVCYLNSVDQSSEQFYV